MSQLQWLLDKRYGTNQQNKTAAKSIFESVRNQILFDAGIKSGDTILDIGCGDGLLGLEALKLIEGHGQVIFNDIDLEAIEHCMSAAREDGFETIIRPLHSSVEKMSELS